MMSTSLLAAGVLATTVLADLTTITAAPSPTKALVARQSGASTYETTSPLPLTEYFYPYSAVPFQVNPYQFERGPQSGYNQCNSTTEGPNSQCQTGIVNSIDDFCLWGAPGQYPNQTIGDVEAAVVAYCSKSGHGARIFPPGTFSAVQFMRTPAYIQVVGLFNQTSLNLESTDTGGELDPHGADFLGNPLGGLVYSTGMPSGDNTTYQQTQSWNNFVGSNQFCFKLCDPSYSTDKNYCQNIYDLLGCAYNAPAAYAPGVFVSCEGELQDEVGTYTSNGQTYTWSQPSSLNPSSTLPWTPRIPASSNCVTYQSSDLFPLSNLGYQSTANAVGASATASASASGSGASAASGSQSAASGSKATGSASKATGSANASASASSTGGAGRVLSGGALAGVVGASVMAMLGMAIAL